MNDAWLIQSFPLPDGMGVSYRFGVVVEATEAAARTAVFDELVNVHGLDPLDHTEAEIILVLWKSPGTLTYGKAMIYHG